MTPPVRFHAADEAQRLASFANVFDVWPMANTLAEHVARRQQSVQHRYARWYVGTRAGEVVVSLACYPLQLAVHGEVLEGIAIGSVHTRADCRRQGLAPQLLHYVEREAAQRGARLSLLYSDIGTDYYARLGYQACPSWEVAWEVDDADDAAGATPSPPEGAVPGGPPLAASDLRLEPCDQHEHSAELRRRYADDHGRRALCVVRTAAYWDHLLQRRPADRWFWLCDSRGERLGYVRCTPAGNWVRISDYALANDEQAALGQLCRAVRAALGRTLPPRLRGWLPDLPSTRACFPLRPRAREITMLKPLDGTVRLDEAARQAANYFCEIDHV